MIASKTTNGRTKWERRERELNSHLLETFPLQPASPEHSDLRTDRVSSSGAVNVDLILESDHSFCVRTALGEEAREEKERKLQSA